MNWPSIVIGAGMAAWVHGAAFAIFRTLGFDSFSFFAGAVGIVSGLVCIIGLIVRAVIDNEAGEERKAAMYNERFESRYNALTKEVGTINTNMSKWVDYTAELGQKHDKLRAEFDAKVTELLGKALEG